VHHPLFIVALVVHQSALVLFQRLAYAGNASVAEHPENTPDEFVFLPVKFNILIVEEFHQGLRHGQPDCFHASPSPRV